jgi:hypothetical protein
MKLTNSQKQLKEEHAKVQKKEKEVTDLQTVLNKKVEQSRLLMEENNTDQAKVTKQITE